MKRQLCSSIGCFLGNVTVVFVFVWSGLLHAHDSHDKEILRLDQQLKQSSPDSESLQLLLRRADLHRQEKNWQAALLDYEKVATTEPQNQRMLLGRAQLYLDQKNYGAASRWSALLLEQNSDHAQALLIQARTQSGLGNFRAAADFYDRAIKKIKNPTPEHFLEHARAILQIRADSAGNELFSEAVAEAIDIVDNGAHQLDDPVSLHSFALNQELLSEKSTAALKRIDRLVSLNPRLFSWQLKKAELLISLDRLDEACLELKSLGNEIRQLPPRRSGTRAMQSLSATISELQSACVNE